MLEYKRNSMAATLLLLLIFTPLGAHGDIYSWVDANGVRHFSNTDTDGAGDRAQSSPEFDRSNEEEERIQREGAERDAGGTNPTRSPARSTTESEKHSEKESGDSKMQQGKEEPRAMEELQARCKKAKERLSDLRFTSFHKYDNPEVERYALEWTSRNRNSEQADEKSDWKKARDEDVQKYKRFKYEQELKQAEKEVDAYCKN
ncbi:MAG: DUF4124 domain-containing protein [Desulfobacterales bacterium]|nr:DUF4124 domain-containing protein [Desulfobacterales bacterium]